jgi:hypothetical protein
MGRDIYLYVARLRAKHGHSKYKVSFPDLKCGSNPCTNGFGPTPKHVPPKLKGEHIVDSLHKQGMMVLSRDELPWAGGKKP